MFVSRISDINFIVVSVYCNLISTRCLVTIVRTIISNVTKYFDFAKRKMGDPLFLGDLIREIGQENGVVNVVDIRVYGKIGGLYSSAEVAPATTEGGAN